MLRKTTAGFGAALSLFATATAVAPAAVADTPPSGVWVYVQSFEARNSTEAAFAQLLCDRMGQSRPEARSYQCVSVPGYVQLWELR
ncbi:hypothetical protein [Amycolatopsis sp. cmx-4-54]|uniref:hypothetical protein n=1 Tax=Amycolatopsis sp. cmx-4-54 TaxID=2790936 RepID=UPI00397CF3B5